MELTWRELMEATQGFNALGQTKLPIKTSFEVMKIRNILAKCSRTGEKDRLKAVKEIRARFDGKNSPEEMELQQEESDKFFEELIEVPIENKIKLPEHISSTCDKCHHNMDKVWEIEPSILYAIDKFVEI